MRHPPPASMDIVATFMDVEAAPLEVVAASMEVVAADFESGALARSMFCAPISTEILSKRRLECLQERRPGVFPKYPNHAGLGWGVGPAVTVVGSSVL